MLHQILDRAATAWVRFHTQPQPLLWVPVALIVLAMFLFGENP